MSQSELLKFFLTAVPAKAVRLAAARGLAPFPPNETLQLLIHLLKDPESEVAQEAEDTLRGWNEEELLLQVQSRACAPSILRYFANNSSSIALQEAIILNPATPTDAVAEIASKALAPALEIILYNRVRLLDNSEILTNIKLNNNVTPEIQRLVQEIEHEFLGDKKSEYRVDSFTEDAPAQVFPETIAPEFLLEDLSLEGVPLESATDETSLLYQVSQMSVHKKRQLAAVGNRLARAFLIRDQNQAVARSVLRNPKLRDEEVGSFAAMRHVPVEVLRDIGNNREWIKSYAVLQNLVRNPKTPPVISQRLLFRLVSKDLQLLSRDRDVPEVVRKSAQRMIGRRSGYRS